MDLTKGQYYYVADDGDDIGSVTNALQHLQLQSQSVGSTKVKLIKVQSPRPVHEAMLRLLGVLPLSSSMADTLVQFVFTPSAVWRRLTTEQRIQHLDSVRQSYRSIHSSPVQLTSDLRKLLGVSEREQQCLFSKIFAVLPLLWSEDINVRQSSGSIGHRAAAAAAAVATTTTAAVSSSSANSGGSKSLGSAMRKWFSSSSSSSKLSSPSHADASAIPAEVVDVEWFALKECVDDQVPLMAEFYSSRQLPLGLRDDQWRAFIQSLGGLKSTVTRSQLLSCAQDLSTSFDRLSELFQESNGSVSAVQAEQWREVSRKADAVMSYVRMNSDSLFSASSSSSSSFISSGGKAVSTTGESMSTEDFAEQICSLRIAPVSGWSRVSASGSRNHHHRAPSTTSALSPGCVLGASICMGCDLHWSAEMLSNAFATDSSRSIVVAPLARLRGAVACPRRCSLSSLPVTVTAGIEVMSIVVLFVLHCILFFYMCRVLTVCRHGI